MYTNGDTAMIPYTMSDLDERRRTMAVSEVYAAGQADRAGDKATRDRHLTEASCLYRAIEWTAAADTCERYRAMPLGFSAASS